MSSSIGSIFKITTFGESHGPGIGVVIDGLPAGITVDFERVQRELSRRKPGQNLLSSQRREDDRLEVLSGIYKGRSLGSPLAILVRNRDMKSGDYLKWADRYRPSHADYTYDAKYGWRTPLGGGRSSARETIGRVAAGAIAAQVLEDELGIQTVAWVDAVSNIEANLLNAPPQSALDVDCHQVRCPDAKKAAAMKELIEQARKDGDSLGGIVGVVCYNVPPGLGDPVFSRLEADLAQACLSIPACKGFENGSGFAGTKLCGSEHNDPFVPREESPEPKDPDARTVLDAPRPDTSSNRSGGIQGGISNGMPLVFRLAFKPTATIHKEQDTVDEMGRAARLTTGGRHDPCVLPRAVPIVEAMINITLMDAYLRQRALQPLWWKRYAMGPDSSL